MEKASRVMYSIANFFTWVIAILCVVGIVFSALSLANVIPVEGDAATYLGVTSLVMFIIELIIALVTIALVRKAKDKNTSKGWDILFIVLGVLNYNPFYVLGGIFGLVAIRR